MITFDSGNTHTQDRNLEQSQEIINSLVAKRNELWFIDVDTEVDTKEIQEYVQESWNDFDTIVVLWIWGSALGTKALLEALYGKYYNEDSSKSWKNIYVLDNIDSESITDLEKVLDISRTLFIFISKSGSTIETLSEYLYFKEQCKAKNAKWKKQFCFIVGENCSMREKLEEDFSVFFVPENIWGRFSVFTPVGLLPLAFSGINIDNFLEWISSAKERLLSPSIAHNPALNLAYIQYEYYKKWKNITVFFPYSSRMFMVWEWYKQLMGESIWKAGEWITLTSSLGVTDQHSQLQLFQDGPADKLFFMLDIETPQEDKIITSDIPDFSFKKLLDIEKYGTQTSLKNEWHPVINMTLSHIDERHIAELLYILMFQIAYLWELFQINAFDQPGVEKSKIITKQKLKQEFWDIDLFHKAFYE